MKDNITIYQKDHDYGNASCLVSLFIFTCIVMMITAYFIPEPPVLKVFLYLTPGLIVLLVIIKAAEFYANKGENVKVLSVTREGMHYFQHAAPLSWDEISEIEIIDKKLAVTVKGKPSSDFSVNLTQTTFEYNVNVLVELLGSYFTGKIYVYETSVSCGC
ncbi:hypothetical protein [Chitinophaga sp. 22620]|uniref:hypothetical protein n=1 Tax=Chitinophaga sp. 22620 TaxID=3453952 RepID=UPI003F859817